VSIKIAYCFFLYITNKLRHDVQQQVEDTERKVGDKHVQVLEDIALITRILHIFHRPFLV